MNHSFAYAFVCLLSLTVVIYTLFERNTTLVSENRKSLSQRNSKTGLCIARAICKQHSSDVHYKYVRDKEFFKNINSANGSKNAEEIQIPSVVHFTRFTGRNSFFRFHELMSVLAAHSAAQLKIYFWFDKEPFGANWEKVLKAIPDICLIQRDENLEKEKDLQRFSRRIRLEVVLEYGGIGLDSDVIILQPLTPFMNNDVTIGITSNIPSDDIVISKPTVPILIKWFLKMKNSRNQDPSKIFSEVAMRNSRLVNVAPKLMKPNIMDLAFLYKEGRPKGIENIVCLKMWFKYHGVEHGPQELKWWNTTVGEIFRYLYYKKGKFKH